MQDRFFSVGRGKLHAVVGGLGVPTFLLHGRDPAFNSWRTWVKNVEPLSTVAQVYALDLLGYGDSDKPEPPLSDAQHVETMGELLEQLGIKQANVIGLSWGGGLALRLAVSHPDRIQKIVLVDANMGGLGAAELSQIQGPVLITWDETDVVIPLAHGSELQRAIPGSQLVTWGDRQRDADANPENRHWSQMSHSREWNRTVTEFLRLDQ